MQKSDLIVGGLAFISLIGVIVLSAMRLDTSVLVPVLATLVGYLVGTKQGAIGSYLGSKL